MRKLLSIVLCLVMVFCFAVPAMAAVEPVEITGTPITGVSDTEANGDNASKDVVITVDAVDPKYRVTVTWDDDMEFKYDFGTWNTETLKYNPAGWADGDTELNVTLTNYSNTKVWVVPTIQNQVNGVTFTLSDNDVALDSADNAATLDVAGTAKTGTFKLTVSGAPTNTQVTSFNVPLTVTVSTTQP